MKHLCNWYRGALLSTAFVGLGALGLTGSAAAADPAEGTVAPIAAHELPNVPGSKLTAVLVTNPPGGKSGAHHHAGSVVAYVVSGAIRSQVSDQGPARVYQAGESFFEAPGSRHLVSENASDSEPASLLAVFVAKDDADLTVFDKK